MPDDLIPILRNDLQLVLIEENGHNYVFMSDRYAYAKHQIAVTYEFYNFFISLEGKVRYSELPEWLGTSDLLVIENIISNIQYLDEMGFLYSSSFLEKKESSDNEYLLLKERPFICSGSSYPENPEELNIFLNKLFSKTDEVTYASNADGLIVPHIDLKLAKESHEVYSAAYHSAKETDFDVIVIFGTSHYALSDFMMLTGKNYSTPLGIAETDRDLIDLWQKESGGALHFDEFAHKPEHSIEYQILLCQYYFRDKKFTVLPVLVGSFHEFITTGKLPETSDRFNLLVNSLRAALKKSGKKPLFIASVDFSHIGRKFEDDFDAAPMLPKIRIEDKILIDSITSIDKKAFLGKIIEDCDKYRICGTSPIYTMMSVSDFRTADFLKYNQWNESETKSAVTFASLAMYH
ncbi:MAG: AmmeMemoRadiSam system protein B [Candidatus Kapabacteria bacterium]|nr:AmmeMemoRadiSam system protein B [Candidatus Kapabacteria bacterium]